MNQKTCTKCYKEFPATEEFFVIDKKKRSGLGSWCKRCKYINQRKWCKANSEKNATTKKVWAQTHYIPHPRIAKPTTRPTKPKPKPTTKPKLITDEQRKKKNISHKNYRKRYPERIRARRSTYMAKRRKATVVSFDVNRWLLSQKPYRCYLCGKRLKDNAKFHIDHRTPLSKGGKHAPWNLGITCPKCNILKSNKALYEHNPTKFRPELAL